MRILFDTCTIMDYLCNRSNAAIVDNVLQLIDNNRWRCIMSAGSIYTLTYLIELDLKRNGFLDKSSRISRLREILNGLLKTFYIPELDWNVLYEGVNNMQFSDLEDSYQYAVARKCYCDYIITDNLSDYKNSDQSSIFIVSPQDFLNKFENF